MNLRSDYRPLQNCGDTVFHLENVLRVPNCQSFPAFDVKKRNHYNSFRNNENELKTNKFYKK